ncbi:glycosyltransferase family 4 protein [Candidatus Woesebacteria bacterium CG_4_10_14_0_2_um_filter_39_14]|uniref:Glycosyltransferase family 4 protein n=1 Tax=Candidatus Woesebacteria bacterium CG_4_10_14_0_2_um_filter_39_14 TaxID=1975054 RepID=A0A2M7TJS9_9BACT|nr:MAG: glycosyltransferase family 4 protein [Candidatus Woesebacteria bacterium CG_4_10_14_0_2_um_filter_39_14]
MIKVALVHDYLKEYGGAERVLAALSEIWPKAPIYTAFCDRNSTSGKAFAQKKIIESWLAPLIKYKNLYSPLRFLAPAIWRSFDFTDCDIVVASSSWYISRGFKVGPKTKVFCYCHTPPRYLYGYSTSIEWQRYWPVRVYALLVNHFLRLYDFRSAQTVAQFIVNSRNTQGRVKKFYRCDSTIIYPPVEVDKIKKATASLKPENFYLVVSRVVGAKGIELAIEAAKKLKIPLKIIGETAGLYWFAQGVGRLQNKYVEFVGRVSDKELYRYYGRCKAFLALATDEDFGITPVEAMAAGRPVIAFRGGGYLESVIEGKTGEFFDEPTVESLVEVLKNFKPGKYKTEDCRKQAEKFSKERFKKEIKKFIEKHAGTSRG